MSQVPFDVLASELRTLLEVDSDLSTLALSQVQIDLLVHHLELVISKNKVMNLTRITDGREALVLHILDSLLFIAHNPGFVASGSTLLDIGTGAGYPGIPLAIVGSCQATLIDSVGKKVKAVDEFVHVLGLADRVSCVHARAEEIPSLGGNEFDFVVARAVSQTNVLIEYATPCLCMGGTLLVGKGQPSNEELRAAISAARICGLEASGRYEYDLPDSLGRRTILCYRKVSKPRIKLPRQNGMAKRNPLGI